VIAAISLLSVFACVVLAVRLLAFHRLIAGLTVVGSWQWAVLAIPALMGSCLACIPQLAVGDGWRSSVQYLAAVMLLAPPVCTLGARKPGIAAWHWFVVTPMLVVLMWPAFSQLISSRGIETIELGTPALIGIGLVMMMSLGTGLGSLLMIPALLYGAAIACCLGPATGWKNVPQSLPLAAPWLLLMAGRMASSELSILKTKLAAAGTISDATDSAWSFFQSCYGLPWTKRFQDRVNQFSPREQWAVRLTLDGFRSPENLPADDQTLAQPLDAFCWVMQRFASDEWIEREFGRFRPHVRSEASTESEESGE
jgi:hypothetical protein